MSKFDRCVAHDVSQLPNDALHHARNITALNGVIDEINAGLVVQDVDTGQFVGLVHGTPRQLGSCLPPHEDVLDIVYPDRAVILRVPEEGMLVHIRNLAQSSLDNTLNDTYGVASSEPTIFGW